RILSAEVRSLFYKPYIRHLEKAKSRIRVVDSSVDPHGGTPYTWTWKTPILYVFRTLTRSYNLFGKGQFIEE
ncbi:MAG TPA: glycosyl transferase, partial [Bacteroidota bacterium]|nr:glycosyl transferase [Bacteroidota bacterium]